MVTGWGRRSGLVTLVVIGVFACASCSSDDGAEAESTLPPINPVVITSVVPITIPTIVSIDPQLVQNCVDYVQFGAFTKNALLTALWDAASQNPGVLRDNCEALALTDMPALQSLSEGWVAMQASLDTLPTTSTIATSVASAPRVTTTTVAPVVTELPPLQPPASEVPPVEPSPTTP